LYLQVINNENRSKNCGKFEKNQLGKRWRYFLGKFRQNPLILKSRVSVSEFFMKSRSRNFLWSLGLEVLTRSRSRTLRSRLHHCYLVLPMQKENTIEIDLSNISFCVSDSTKFHYLECCKNAWNCTKLQQFFDGVAWNFSYTQVCKIHHLATLFDNVVSNYEKSNEIVHSVFWQTFTNSSKSTAKLQIIMAKSWQNSAKFLHQTIYFSNGPNTNCVT